MFSTLSTNALYTYFFNAFKDPNNSFILDPLSCVIRLSVLAFKPEGTKISITRNKISYNEPCILQGTIRWTQGDNRDDLHNIYKPLEKACEWYDLQDKNLVNIFLLAIKGLEKLKKSYTNNSTINHSIDRYILVIKENIDINPKNINLRSTRNSNSSANEYSDNNHIFEELKQLWSEREINIVNNLLLQVQDDYEKNQEVNHYLSSLEHIVNMKEKRVFEMLLKATSILE